MKNPKTKKIGKDELVGFAAFFCAIFSLIYIVGLLLVANIFNRPQMSLAKVALPVHDSCSCKGTIEACSLSALPAVLFPVGADSPNEMPIKLAMDDAGYVQKQLDIVLSSSRLVQITNNGVNPHSFVIDELGIDSGEISPGQSKTLRLENMDDAVSYFYYSSVAGDTREKFSGVLMAK